MPKSDNTEGTLIILSDTLYYQKNSKLSFDERLEFLYPMAEESIEPLPRQLSATDKSTTAMIDINNPFRIEYLSDALTEEMEIGSGDNACVRANNPIPITVGIYYFEIKVLSEGKKGRPYIGLTSSTSNLHRAPGWDFDTYGFHGDDGKVFGEPNYHQGQNYGPTFTTNDVVGCGVNFENQTCFFTKNGICLGVAFSNMPMTDLYPTVGVGSIDESLEVNFGQHPFIYNISIEQILHAAHSNDLRMKRKISTKRTLR